MKDSGEKFSANYISIPRGNLPQERQVSALKYNRTQNIKLHNNDKSWQIFCANCVIFMSQGFGRDLSGI